MANKVSWNELEVGECFFCGSGLYKRLSEDKLFYFNGHTEMPVNVKENKDNKVFVRTKK